MQKNLPEHLADQKHWDWPWPFKYIPRSWNAVCWGAPKKIFGNQTPEDGVLKPIGQPNTFQFSYYPQAPWWAKITGLAFYAAYSGDRKEDGKYRHFRLGGRYDDVDDYTNLLSFATRRYQGGIEDTST